MQYPCGEWQFFQGSYLVLQKHLVDRILKFCHFNDFDANWFTSLVVDAFVHGAAVPFANMLIDLVSVPFYRFHHVEYIVVNY